MTTDRVVRGEAVDGAVANERRLPRGERREQILGAATRAFARAGAAGTSLEDIAAEAGVSRVILYRHFDSKTDLYRAILDRVCTRLAETVGREEFSDDSIPALLDAAAADPDGFRLLFRHAAREPEFRDDVSEIRAAGTAIARRYLGKTVPDPSWAQWAAKLVPVVVIEAVIAWLDAGQPNPDEAATRIRRAVDGVLQGARLASLSEDGKLPGPSPPPLSGTRP